MPYGSDGHDSINEHKRLKCALFLSMLEEHPKRCALDAGLSSGLSLNYD